jgi:hypothetical protein
VILNDVVAAVNVDAATAPEPVDEEAFAAAVYLFDQAGSERTTKARRKERKLWIPDGDSKGYHVTISYGQSRKR